MLHINVLYIYPKIIEINKEINLFRIIDNNIKETLVFYCKKGSNYKIMMMDTMSGENKEVLGVSKIEGVETFIKNIEESEGIIKSLNSLEDIKKYILNLKCK